MRHFALPALLAAALAAPLAAEEGALKPVGDAPATTHTGDAPPAAHADDARAQARELEKKLRALREQTVKADPELVKLKGAVDDAQKAYEAAVEAKLKDNPDYQAAKKQLDELRPKKEGKKDEPKKGEVHEQH